MEDVTKTNLKAFDDTVDEYYENTKNLEVPQIMIRKDFLKLVNKNRQILDLGCGPGRDAKYFSDKGYKVIGIDISPRMITKAKQIAPDSEFKVMSFLNLQFEADSLGAVWFEDGLICIRKGYAPKLLGDIRNRVVRGGIFYVSVSEGEEEGFEHDENYDIDKYSAYYTEDEMKKLLNNAHFDILRTYRPDLKSSLYKRQWICFLCRRRLLDVKIGDKVD